VAGSESAKVLQIAEKAHVCQGLVPSSLHERHLPLIFSVIHLCFGIDPQLEHGKGAGDTAPLGLARSRLTTVVTAP
jgi:hypothetical protein